MHSTIVVMGLRGKTTALGDVNTVMVPYLKRFPRH